MNCSHRHLFQRKNSLNKLLSDFFQQKAKSLTLNHFIKFKDRNTNDFFEFGRMVNFILSCIIIKLFFKKRSVLFLKIFAMFNN